MPSCASSRCLSSKNRLCNVSRLRCRRLPACAGRGRLDVQAVRYVTVQHHWRCLVAQIFFMEVCVA
jgi:hypothetical protein